MRFAFFSHPTLTKPFRPGKIIPQLLKGACYAFFCLLAYSSYGQSAANETENAYSLPPLDSLVQLCLSHSPELKMKDAQIQQKYFTLKAQKQDWTQLVGVRANAGVGNRVFTQNTDGNIDLVNTPFPYYNTGIGVSVPLSLLTNRKNQVGVVESSYRATQLEKDVKAQEIVDVVTTLYYQLITNINILKIRRDALQAMQIQKSLAEKELENGNIGISEMTEIIKSVAEEEAQYETFKQQFLMNWKQMENLIGKPLKIKP